MLLNLTICILCQAQLYVMTKDDGSLANLECA